MLVLEHDAKSLIAGQGVPVPAGYLLQKGDELQPDLPGPWMAKAQVTAGKRGKRGGVVKCDDLPALESAVDSILGLKLGALSVDWVRVEQCVEFVRELYLSISYDPKSGMVQLIVSAEGGVEIESVEPSRIHTRFVEADPQACIAAGREVAALIDPALRDVIEDAVAKLANAFFALDATLLEINPLFVRNDGSWIAGDAKLILDEGAFERRPENVAFVHANAARYPETDFKLREGFDYIKLDENGRVGLVTTGAGLTMMVVDEMTMRGAPPYNFLDIRTGQIHSEPDRLVTALSMIKQGRNVDRLLVNIFAGITDLLNFAQRFLEAAAIVDLSGFKIFVRIEGLNRQAANQLLLDSPLDVQVFDDLQDAIKAIAQ